MEPLFSNKPKWRYDMGSLSPLQRLLTLLISGNSQSIDTAAKVEFLLNYRQDSIDTPMEIKEFIDSIRETLPTIMNNPSDMEIQDFIESISAKIPKNISNQEFNAQIELISKKLEVTCQQNSPSPSPTPRPKG